MYFILLNYIICNFTVTWLFVTKCDVTWRHDELWRKVTNCAKLKIKNCDAICCHMTSCDVKNIFEKSSYLEQKKSQIVTFHHKFHISTWNVTICDELWRFFKNNFEVTWRHVTSHFATNSHVTVKLQIM